MTIHSQHVTTPLVETPAERTSPLEPAAPSAPGRTAEHGAGSTTRRGWALAGLLAGVTGAAAIACSMAVDAVYAAGDDPDAAAVNAVLGDQIPQMVAFHVLGVTSAVLMLVFAAGLFRRLRAGVGPDSLAPSIATFGVLGTAFVLMLGTGLDTEFSFAAGTDIVVPEAIVVYNHWIGTIPWCWGLLGLSGIALFAAARAGRGTGPTAVPRWIGLVGLIGGGVTLLLGISPLQYMAGMTGPIGLVVIALGFLVGDRAFRARG